MNDCTLVMSEHQLNRQQLTERCERVLHSGASVSSENTYTDVAETKKLAVVLHLDAEEQEEETSFLIEMACTKSTLEFSVQPQLRTVVCCIYRSISRPCQERTEGVCLFHTCLH